MSKQFSAACFSHIHPCTFIAVRLGKWKCVYRNILRFYKHYCISRKGLKVTKMADLSRLNQGSICGNQKENNGNEGEAHHLCENTRMFWVFWCFLITVTWWANECRDENEVCICVGVEDPEGLRTEAPLQSFCFSHVTAEASADLSCVNGSLFRSVSGLWFSWTHHTLQGAPATK